MKYLSEISKAAMPWGLRSVDCLAISLGWMGSLYFNQFGDCGVSAPGCSWCHGDVIASDHTSKASGLVVSSKVMMKSQAVNMEPGGESGQSPIFTINPA